MSGPPARPLSNGQQSPASGSQYQSLVNRQTTASVTVAGTALSNSEQLRALLNSLSPDQVIEALRQIQRQIQLNAELLQDIAFDTWNVAQDHADVRAYRSTDAAAFSREFAILREGHAQSKIRRNRLAAARKALTQSWMNEYFLDIVVTEQTTGSTAIYDALVAAMRDQNQNLTPLQLFQRASAFRHQRIVGIGPYNRASGERTITVQDIRNAFATVQNGPERAFAYATSVDSKMELNASRTLGLMPDQRSLYWVGGVQPNGIYLAYQNGGGQAPRAATLNTTPSAVSTPQTNSLFRRRQPEREKPELNYAGQDKGTKGTKGIKRNQPTWVRLPKAGEGSSSPGQNKRPKVARYGPTPVDIVDLISGLRTLKVAPGTPPPSREDVRPQPNPLRTPTALDSAIWAHALRKARAIHDSREPEPLTEQQKKTLSDAANSMPNLYASICRLSDAIQERGRLDDANLRAYMEGLADGSAAAWAVYNRDQVAVQDIRRLVGSFRSLFGTGRARIGNGNEYQQGMEVTLRDFESLMRDEQHGGWLTGVTLMAALLGIMHASSSYVRAFVVHVDHVYGFRTGGIRASDVVLPSTATNLVLPFHWGNHWTVALVNVQTRTIRHLDSAPEQGRNEAAINAVLRLLMDVQGVFGPMDWTIDRTPSGLQDNFDDCGIWVIENARGLLEGTDHEPIVGPATRRFIAEELLLHLREWTPNTGPNQREAAVAQVRQVTDGPSQSGANLDPDFRVSTFAPGLDMPYLRNAPFSRPSSPRAQTTRVSTPRSSRQSSVLSDVRTDLTDPFTPEPSDRGGRGGEQDGRGRGLSRGGEQDGRGRGLSRGGAKGGRK